MRCTARLGAYLNDAILLLASPYHLLAFEYVVRTRFFAVHILAGQTSSNRDRSMPVVRCGNDDKINISAIEDAFLLTVNVGPFTLVFLNAVRKFGRPASIHIADGNELAAI